MSLFSTLQVASNALNAAQIGLQVVSNNVANANTPGYARQAVDLVPASPQRVGDLTLGLGVRVAGIRQQVDEFLNERLRGAQSDAAGSETQETAYSQLETLIGALNDTDLSKSLSNFFGSIQDILNQPDSESVRNLAVLKGDTLAGDFQRLFNRGKQIQQSYNEQIANTATDINSLTKKIADLNVKIASAEGGSVSKSQAVGLRDQRSAALTDLSKILDIRVSEQPTGDVVVLVGGEFLVSQGVSRDVKSVFLNESASSKNAGVAGINRAEIRLEATDAPLQASKGKLAGLVQSRDGIVGGFLEKLDGLAKSLASEFNKIYSSGQGLTGYSSLTSEFSVDNPQSALDQAGLPYTPTNGSFQILLKNTQTGISKTHDIRVDLNGLDGDDSLNSIVSQISSIDGLTAIITPTRQLQIRSDSPNVRFSFSNDSSGLLAGLGVNTFFSGSGAGNLRVNQQVRSDPGKFAASRGGIGEDSDNAVKLASLLNAPLASLDGKSLAVQYDAVTNEVAQGSSVAKSVAEGFRTFQQALDAQQKAISGVSLDEETLRMVAYQRAFQASARVVSTISDLLDILVKL